MSQLLHFLTAPFRLLLALPMKLVSAPRRLLGLSLPARVALVTALLLLVCAVVAFMSVLLPKDRADWRNYWMRWDTPVVFVLLVVIPLVVYYALRAWLEGEESRYPDIAEAWRQGLAALQENGIQLGDLPLFLVLGAPDETLIRSLFAASGLNFLVRHVPAGRTPLHWYADENSIFLVCRDVGKLSQLNGLAGGRAAPGHAADREGTAPAQGESRGTLVGSGGARDTTAFFGGGEPEAESPESSGGRFGTLLPGGLSEPARGGTGRSTPVAAVTPALSRRETEEQTDRLRYLCSLLVRGRQPLCPLNGVLTVLPFPALCDVLLAKDLPGAVQSDFQTLRQGTRLCCPVAALVTGMEREQGFTELVRRVGTSKAKANRFGKGFSVWNPPAAERIDAFSAHACGVFEDWVYSLFREKDGLSKPGNARLYTLLCRIRSELRGRLRNVLVHGYSLDPEDSSAASQPLLFSGCYFAATGATDDQQAFVRNVFEKMVELEEELDWTDEAWAEDDRYQALARLGLGLSSLLILGLVAMVVYRIWFRGP